MTSQFSSEKDLFDQTEETTARPQSHRKRPSLGPRLPISPPSKTMSQIEKGNGRGLTSPSPGDGGQTGPTSPPRGYSGTMLGFGNMNFSDDNPLILKGKDRDGNMTQLDVFNSVFVNGMPSGQLEQLLNYLEVKGKLDFSSFIEGVIYQGFDREFYIKTALKKVPVSVFCKFAILGAVRGSNFTKIVNSCVEMPQELVNLVNNNVVIKSAKKRDDLTILRFTASIPHWVAFWLFSVAMPKKIESEDCPGWLQFPGAASLPMGKKQRLQHISFCKAFSALLPGGSFNGNIYYTAYSNQVPTKNMPKMIKDGLGISETDTTSGTITASEVQDITVKSLVKK